MLLVGVPITKSGKGIFAAVLRLVEYYSGIPETDVERYVRQAFEHDYVKELLRTTAPNIRRRRRS